MTATFVMVLNLAGGSSPEPGAPYSPDLTPKGNLAQWSQEEFLTVMQSGKTPDGSPIGLGLYALERLRTPE